jgi:hypothetical protein
MIYLTTEWTKIKDRVRYLDVHDTGDTFWISIQDKNGDVLIGWVIEYETVE